MIKSIHMINYRCFEDTKVLLKDIIILVGKNNAGKSSLVEALRIAALALRKSQHTTYKQLPKEFGVPIRDMGFRLDVEKLKIDLRSIVYRYDDKIAKVRVEFDDKVILDIYGNRDYVYAVIYDQNGRCIKNKNHALNLSIEKVSILPQIGLIKENEKRLTNETIEKDRETYLSSRHFRNEIYNYREDYMNEFVSLAQQTWRGLRINTIEYNAEDDLLTLYISDMDFYAEIGMMGSGLQMWLQIMWFIARTKGDTTIILDEPDVYMHPDLQRKLIRMVKGRYPQVIVATHSIEIISEVEPENIITVDKKCKRLRYASDLQAVQSIVDEVGAVNNLSLMRIGSARKCIFVEGKDLKILSKIAEVIYGKDIESLEILPHVSLGGFNNLREAFGAAKLFKEETNGTIRCMCILDRDYFSEETIAEKYKEAEKSFLELHIWKRKEIENYLLEPRVLFRLSKLPPEKYEEFIQKLENLADSYKDQVFDQYAEHIQKYKKGNVSETNKIARAYVNDYWKNLNDKLMLIGGKEFLRAIKKWYRTEYKVSLSDTKIISEFRVEEFDKEIVDVIYKLIN